MENNGGKELIQEKIENEKEKVLEKTLEQEVQSNGNVEPQAVNEVEEVQNEEGAVIRYKRVDIPSGEITDPDMIELYKITQLYDVVFNNMLGDYDDVGEYVISKDILNALVKVSKRVVRAYADTLYLESFTDFPEKGKIQFSLSFMRADETKQKAILKILEPVSQMNGYIVNTHTFLVATYTDENNDDYLKKVYKVFHIYNSADEVGKEDPEIVNAILQRLKMLEFYREELLVGLKEREEKYFLDRLLALRDPRFEDLLKEFERLKEKSALFLNPDHPLYFLFLNQLLDTAIYNYKFAINEEKRYLLNNLQRQAIRDYALATALVVADINQKLEEKFKIKEAVVKLDKAKKLKPTERTPYQGKAHKDGKHKFSSAPKDLEPQKEEDKKKEPPIIKQPEDNQKKKGEEGRNFDGSGMGMDIG